MQHESTHKPPVQVQPHGLLSVIHHCVTLHLAVGGFNLFTKQFGPGDDVYPGHVWAQDSFWPVVFSRTVASRGKARWRIQEQAGRKGQHAGPCNAKFKKALLGPGCHPVLGSQRYNQVLRPRCPVCLLTLHSPRVAVVAAQYQTQRV